MSSHAQARLEQAQEQYDAVAALLDELEPLLPRLEELRQAMQPLMTYYYKQWGADRDAAPDAMVGVAGEDTIWDLHGRQFELMRALLSESSRFFTDPAD